MKREHNKQKKYSNERRQRFAPKRMEQAIEIAQKQGLTVNKITVFEQGFTLDTTNPSEAVNNGAGPTAEDELERWRRKKNAS